MLPHLKPCPIFPTRGHCVCIHIPYSPLQWTICQTCCSNPTLSLGGLPPPALCFSYDSYFVHLVSGVTGVHLTACHSVILTSSSFPSYLSSGGPYQRGHPTQLLPYSVIFTLRLNRHWALSLLLTCSFSYLPHSFLTGPDSFAPFFILHSPPMCRVCWPCLGNIVTI